MSNILLLEDDLSLINGLSFAFKKQGFELVVARTLKEADSLWMDGKYDLLVLDVSLPDGTGFEFCKKVRQVSKVPIIFLTAADEEMNIIMGLDIGGDDYITKPFKLGVLVSRVNALLRRAKDFSSADTQLESNGMKVLLLQGQAFKNGKLLDLTAAEYKLLCLFMKNPNMVLTKEQILDKLWDCDGNYIDSSSAFDVPARLNGDTGFSGTIDLISYDDFDLQCLKKDGALKRESDLSKVYGDSHFVLATSDQDSTWKIGDTVQIGDETLTIAGLLKNDPFSEDGLTNGKLTLITSGETFIRLTGNDDYSLVLIQTAGNVTDENVQAIQNSVDKTYSFRDKRDERTTGTYMAFVFCVYAFLAIIALVTVMNIINSISMSVSTRMKQYGAMRAVGMDERQMTKMIACEAFTYAVLGCVVGCAIGLPLSKLLYDFLIAGHFPSAVWQFPITSLGIILLFVSIAAIAAVYTPAKRIRNMSITATINEL